MREPRLRNHGEAGISLLEVLIAVSLLGISFSAVFSGFSSALRTVDRLDRYDQSVDYATRKVNELLLDPTLAPGQQRSGVSESGIRWRATTHVVERRPWSDPERPVQLMRVTVEVSWATPAGTRSFSLQTLKLWTPEAARALQE